MSFEKADFQGIYNESTSESYIKTLSALHYRNPDFVHAPLLQVVDSILARQGRCTVLDVACSYGFNGAILKYELPFGGGLQTARRENMRPGCRIIGLDISANAISFALKHEIIDHCIVQDLENETLSAEGADVLQDVDLIVASGAFSYVGESTFDQLLSAIGKKPAFLGWPTFACDPAGVCRSFARRGIELRIENVAYPMRDFVSTDEQNSYFYKIDKQLSQIRNHALDKLSVYKIASV